MRVKCLDQEHNRISLARAQPGPLNFGSSTVAMRLLCIPLDLVSVADCFKKTNNENPLKQNFIVCF